MLQEQLNAAAENREDSETEILEINAKGAIVFVIVASVFLLLLFYFMSSWFVWLLIVLFCIGGIEVLFYFPILVTGNLKVYMLRVTSWYSVSLYHL